MDAPSVMRAALELLRNREYPGLVAVCADALTDEPDNVHLRLVLARGLLALRRDIEAQSHLRECLRLDPRCSDAYRLLGELSLRRDELGSAAIFFREALRLDPHDRHTGDLLELVQRLNQPTAAVEKLPAATVAVGCPSPSEPAAAPPGRRRLAHGTVKPPPLPPPRRRPKVPAAQPPRPAPPPAREPRMALGTSSDVPGTVAGFGHYLVAIGVLTPVQLRAALAYHRTSGVRVGAAAVALGFLSQPRAELAAASYHGQRRQRR